MEKDNKRANESVPFFVKYVNQNDLNLYHIINNAYEKARRQNVMKSKCNEFPTFRVKLFIRRKRKIVARAKTKMEMSWRNMKTTNINLQLFHFSCVIIGLGEFDVCERFLPRA